MQNDDGLLVPPNDEAAEMCLLASMMLAREVIPVVRERITAESFLYSEHATIFRVLCHMADARQEIDAVTLRAELVQQKLFEECGGSAYLAKILNAVPSSAHAEHYAKIVEKLHFRRAIAEAGLRLQKRAFAASSEDDGGVVLADAIASLTRLVRSGGKGVDKLGDVVFNVADGIFDPTKATPKVPIGFRDLDAPTGGIMLGELWILGARPSIGKSLFCKQSALNAAKLGAPTVIISLEESAAKIARNALASEVRVSNHLFRNPSALRENDLREIGLGVSRLQHLPLWIIHRKSRLDDIAASLAALTQKEGIQYAIVDYLQLVDAGGQSDFEKATNSSKGITRLVKEVNVACLAAVQLNRALEGRDVKNPTIADIRSSGQIEQDADAILGLHREDYYHIYDPIGTYTNTRIAEVSILKMRDGVRGNIVQLETNLEQQRFEDSSGPTDPFQ